MSKRQPPTFAKEAMGILSYLLLSPDAETVLAGRPEFSELTRANFDELVALAHSNHVIVRGLEAYRGIVLAAGDINRSQWPIGTLSAEKKRIGNAVTWVSKLCETLKLNGVDVTVMKSLDHWPDFGSDIDLYTNSSSKDVVAAMRSRFGAEIAPRSWGDRLAGKWNFLIPTLEEAVEVHAGRLGQTGEQRTLGAHLPARRRFLSFDGHLLPVPSASDRIMISTLQRMYRHFYFRLCDIVDSAELVKSGVLDCDDLRRSARAAGIWEGVATYLVLVRDYVRRYGGEELDLPGYVLDAARFDGKTMYLGGNFLRVPILPQSLSLYRTQLAGLLRRCEVHSSLRLGTLPFLASAAAVGYKITGSDKGIW